MNESKKAKKTILDILKVIWIPVLLISAFLIGLYIGYKYITGSSGADIFSREVWKRFFDQFLSLQ